MNLMSQKIVPMSYYAGRALWYLAVITFVSFFSSFLDANRVHSLVYSFVAAALCLFTILANFLTPCDEEMKNLREWAFVTRLSVRLIPRNVDEWAAMIPHLVSILEGYARQATEAIEDRDRAQKQTRHDIKEFVITAPRDIIVFRRERNQEQKALRQATRRAEGEHKKFLRAWDLIAPLCAWLKDINPDQWRKSLAPKTAE